MQSIGIILLLFLFASLPAVGSDLHRKSDPAAYAYAVRALNQTLTAACGGEVRPDRVLIVGGLSVQSLKPLEARAQLERQLQPLEEYVTQQGGAVRRLERLRAVRELSNSGHERAPDQLPFLLLQQLELEFPLEADIDAVLDRVLQFGLDRYGRSPQLGYQDDRPKVVVRYRFSDLAGTLNEIHRRCQMEAWQQWCLRGAAGEFEQCAEAGASLLELFITNALYLQSQPVLTEHGGSAPLSFNYPWAAGQVENVELLGDVVVRLSGTITLTLRGNQ